MRHLNQADLPMGLLAATLAAVAATLPRPSFAVALEAYGQNLSDCIQSLPDAYSWEKRLRFCKARRARSLLFSDAHCTHQSLQVYRGCKMADSASLNDIAVVTSEANSQRPMKRLQVFKAYRGWTFRDAGRQYRITDAGSDKNKLQRSSGNSWTDQCTFSFGETGYRCFRETGMNHSGQSSHSSIRCTYESSSFSLSLSHILITVQTSRRVSESGPLNYRFYRCVIDTVTHSVPWP